MSGYRPPRFTGLGAHVSGVSAWVLAAMLEQVRAWDRLEGLQPHQKSEVLQTLDAIKASAIHWSDQIKTDDGPPRRVRPEPTARPKPELDGHVTATQAAGRIGCTERRVRQMLKEEKLRGQQVAGIWLVEEQSVEDYLVRKEVA